MARRALAHTQHSNLISFTAMESFPQMKMERALVMICADNSKVIVPTLGLCGGERPRLPHLHTGVFATSKTMRFQLYPLAVRRTRKIIIRVEFLPRLWATCRGQVAHGLIPIPATP